MMDEKNDLIMSMSHSQESTKTSNSYTGLDIRLGSMTSKKELIDMEVKIEKIESLHTD
jgi:hypothetical protein